MFCRLSRRSFVITERNEESKFTRAAYELTVRSYAVVATPIMNSTQSSERGVFSLSHSLLPYVFRREGKKRRERNYSRVSIIP